MESFDFKKFEKENIQDLVTLNQNFSHLIDYLKASLELDPLYTKITIKWEEKEGESLESDLSANIFDLGIKRAYEYNTLTLTLSKHCLHLIPFILLREAYYCFIPSNLISNKEICILINHIIEEQLHRSEQNSKWRALIQKVVVDYVYLSSELDKLKGIIKVQKKPIDINIIRFLLEYIRNNSWFFESNSSGNIHNHLLKALIEQSSPLFFNDERIETLRMLILIFYRLKKFNSLSDYLKCFQDILLEDPKATNLTVWKFESNARLISKMTQIAPSYQINWTAIGLISGILYIRFHPQLSQIQITSLLQYFPFLTGVRRSESNFALEIIAYVVIPQKYVEDLKNLLDKMRTNGYALQTLFTAYSEGYNSLNLNYFREFYSPGRLINPLHKAYDKNYELEVQIIHQKGKNHPISVLEYLLLNRFPSYAADGFGFERDTNKLAIIKLDLLHELASQKRLIEKLKKILTTIYARSELKDSFILLLKNNQNYGFFYLHEFLKNLVLLTIQLINC